jgi:hypothetical protein
MSETKFTPGPWRANRTSVRALKRTVADCEFADVSPLRVHPEDMANARLIAAAPDLYEALVAITDQMELVGDARKDAPFIETARAAIAKAEGRT